MKQPVTVEEWLSLNQENLVTCPYHFGDLKITRSACRQRRQKALEWNYIALLDQLFHYGYEQHLKICLNCDRIPAGEVQLATLDGGQKKESNFRGPSLKRSNGKRETTPR